MSFCLTDYVGLRPCNFIPSLSGMYLDQLPGIEIAELDSVANAEQVTYQGVWDDLQATASDTFMEDINQEFGKRYLLKQITQSVDLGKKYSTTIITAPIAGHRYGLLFETKQENSQFACSNLQKIYIQSASFFWQGVNPNPSFTLTFVDAETLTTLQTTTVSTAVAGWNDVWLDSEFSARRLYMFVSGNFDTYVQLDLSNFFLNNFSGPGYTWGWNATNYYAWVNFGGGGCQARIQGVDYTTATNSANPASTNTFGLSVVMSTRCSYESIVCRNKKHFASSWQHCLAIEFMNYRINSSRLNKWTTITKDMAISLQTLFTHKYRGGVNEKTGLEYPGKLQIAVTSLKLNDADCCLQCNDRYNWQEVRL